MLAAASPDVSWTFDPVPVVLVIVAGVLYVPRWRAVRAGVWRLVAFLAALLVGALALLSPVDRLGEQLFAMHMLQHVLLLDVAPILGLLGLTRVLLRPVTRRLMRLEEVAGPVGHPYFAIAAYVAVMWLWHVPALYDAANEHAPVHVLEHVTFFGAGALYWWHLLSPIRSRRRLGGLGPVVYMAVTKILVGLLGIALTFAPEAIYRFYETQPRYWGLSAGTDQAVGGLIMATEQSVLMGIALVWLFVRALSESEREEQRRERYEEA